MKEPLAIPKWSMTMPGDVHLAGPRRHIYIYIYRERERGRARSNTAKSPTPPNKAKPVCWVIYGSIGPFDTWNMFAWTFEDF